MANVFFFWFFFSVEKNEYRIAICIITIFLYSLYIWTNECTSNLFIWTENVLYWTNRSNSSTSTPFKESDCYLPAPSLQEIMMCLMVVYWKVYYCFFYLKTEIRVFPMSRSAFEAASYIFSCEIFLLFVYYWMFLIIYFLYNFLIV